MIAGVPTTDFSDNRVMRAPPRDLYDVYEGTFDYLYANEPMGLIVIVVHCQFGGRPLITAVLQEVLKYIAGFPDVCSRATRSWRNGRSPPTSTSTRIRVGFRRRRLGHAGAEGTPRPASMR